MSGGHEERLTLFLAEQFAAFGGQKPFNSEVDGVEVVGGDAKSLGRIRNVAARRYHW